MNYPKYYIDMSSTQLLENQCVWRVINNVVTIGMNDSPFELSGCTEDDLKCANGIQRITKREAKSLFPNLIK